MSEAKNSTEEEIQDLIKLAQNDTKQERTELFNAITALIESRHQQISNAEIDLMIDILTKLITEVEISLRKKLSLKLANNDQVPVELIILLANDAIEVANPILIKNTLLSDKELVRIIQIKSRQHQLSIAARETLSSGICRELVKSDDDGVIITMLANKGAKIDNDTIEEIVSKSKTREVLQSPLVHRHDLPRDIAARMYSWISTSLKNELMEIHSFNAEELEQTISSSIGELKSEDQFFDYKVNADIKLIKKLKSANKLHISFLMKSLRQGNISLFELAFAEILNIPYENICNILYERGPSALVIACKAAGIGKPAFLTMFRLTRDAKKMDTGLSETEIEHTYKQFTDTGKQRAQVVLNKWVEDCNRIPIF